MFKIFEDPQYKPTNFQDALSLVNLKINTRIEEARITLQQEYLALEKARAVKELSPESWSAEVKKQLGDSQ